MDSHISYTDADGYYPTHEDWIALHANDGREERTMTITTYKGYTIQVIGLSHYIHRPGEWEKRKGETFPETHSEGYAHSMSEAKRWANEDIKESQREQEEVRKFYRG